MKLYVMRHAKSSWQNLKLKDHDRPLKKTGKKATKLMCEFFVKNQIKFDLTYVSSSKRALETLKILKNGLKIGKIVKDKKLYLASKEKLISILKNTSNKYKSILLINHEPASKDLILNLCKIERKPNYRLLKQKFPTAAFAEIEFSYKNWSKIKPKSGRLIQFVRPKDLYESRE